MLSASPVHTEMAGLEWSTGSSTQWVLMRVKTLISIEHHAKWSKVCLSRRACA